MANNHITYQLEDYDLCRLEIDAFLPDHWREIALNKDEIPLDKDEASYRQLADAGALHILTVRKSGVLVGYIAGIVRPHLHYRSSLHCFTDVFYVKPECRRGRIGIELFKRYRETLKARGVKKVFIASKCHLDMSKVFERLGWTRTEVVYSIIP
jgi:hypothetical protein